MHADDKERRFAAIDDVADAIRYLIESRRRPRTASRAAAGLTAGTSPRRTHLSPRPVRRGNQHLRDERPEHLVPHHRTVDRRSRSRQVRPSGRLPGPARPVVATVERGRDDRAVSVRPWPERHQRSAHRSQQMYDALRALGRNVELLVFDDDGHEIDRRENRAVLVRAMNDWLTVAFARTPIL